MLLKNIIRPINIRNKKLEVKTVIGLSSLKKFRKTTANIDSSDISNYKIIKKGQFGCDLLNTIRTDRFAVALQEDYDMAAISPAYHVFDIIDGSVIFPKYLMLWFTRSECDRRLLFMTDSSVRGEVEWERFCELEIPLPAIDEQKKFVSVYDELFNNQKCCEKNIVNLQLICDSFMEDLAKKKDLKILGDYIQQLDERNSELKIRNLLGISINKKFFPSNTNQTDLDVRGCKIVRPGQFGFVTVTSRNGEKISIGLLDGDAGIVSSTYVVFNILEEEKLLPEFLLLWFKRLEFDRYARFYSWGSARETFNWEDMCSIKLPIPDIKVQRSIVAIHHALESRKRINEDLKNMITPLCSILMKGVVNNLAIN